MNPVLEAELELLRGQIKELMAFKRAFLSAAELDPQIQRTITEVIGSNLKLSDLTDVEGTDTATTGQVLKKTASTWQPGTDETV